MKKKILLLVLLLIGMFIPTNVFATRSSSASPAVPAAEIAITEGEERLVYFLQYPNGYETATENQDVANNPEEVLIYEGPTNTNGEITLAGLNNQGQLRIVQDVPEGYTTTAREALVDLSNSSTTSFTNYKGFINPNTGRNIIIVLIIAILVCVVAISIMKKQNSEENKEEKRKRKETKKSKKEKALILILLPLISILFGLSYRVNANQKDFIITVKDNHGNKMSNVDVKVYAKPIVEESNNTIKFSSGDGTFFDGTTEMYFRLPSENCTFRDFKDSLTKEQLNYLYDNWNFGSKGNGYGNLKLYELDDQNPTLNNNISITEAYIEDQYASVIELDGNGGYIDFYGKKLSSFKSTFEDYTPLYYSRMFTKADGYSVGVDINKNCSNYEVYNGEDGINALFNSNPSKVYVCYDSKPDGIYINDYIYYGSVNSCFRESDYNPVEDAFQIRTIKQGSYGYDKELIRTVAFTNISELDDSELVLSYIFPTESILKAYDFLSGKELEFDEEAQVEVGSSKRVEENTVDETKSKAQMMVSDVMLVQKGEYPAAEEAGKPFERVINGEPISSIEIVENGTEILAISGSDITCTGSGELSTLPRSECRISASKKQALLDYLSRLKTACFRDPVVSDFPKDKR